MEIDWVKFLTTEFKNAKTIEGDNGKELNIDCISEDCPNPKKHMFVNLGSSDQTHDKMFICQRCGIGGNHKAFLVAYFKLPIEDIILNFGDIYGSEADPFHMAIQSVKNCKNLSLSIDSKTIDDGFIIELPNGFYKLKGQNKFLKKREVTTNLIKKFNLGLCKHGVYRDRIIIPVETKNNRAFIAYSQYGKKALDFFKEKSKKSPENKSFDRLKKKILNPFGSTFTSLLFNYNNIKKNEKIIFIHEGVMDVFRTLSHGFSAVGIFKNVISKHQAILLSEKDPLELCLMLDSDVDDELLLKSYNMVKEFCDCQISITKLKKGDPDDIKSKSDFIKIINCRKFVPYF